MTNLFTIKLKFQTSNEILNLSLDAAVGTVDPVGVVKSAGEADAAQGMFTLYLYVIILSSQIS